MKIAVVAVTHQRQDLLKDFLQSLQVAAAKAGSEISLYLAINGQDAHSEELILDAASKAFGLSEAVQLNLEKWTKPVSPSAARNYLLNRISSCSFDWVVFLDDDIALPSDFFSNFEKLAAIHSEALIWGGPNLTLPTASEFQQVIGDLLACPLVAGPVSARYRRGLENSKGHNGNLMLCNLIFKSELLQEISFVEHLKTGEENELIAKIAESGKAMGFSNGLLVYHDRRSSWNRVVKQWHFYGYGRGQLFKEVKWSQQILYFIFLVSFPVIFAYLALHSKITLGLWIALAISILIWMKASSHRFQLSSLRLQSVFYVPLLWSVYWVGLLKGLCAPRQAPKHQSQAIESYPIRYSVSHAEL